MVTHDQLVAAGAQWLKRKCGVIITEMATSGEEPDVIGWQNTFSTLIECKISRADFRADREKPFRRSQERGMGMHRYFLTPAGLVTLADLPPKWGLLEFDGEKVRVVRKSEFFAATNHRHEIGVLLSTIRRIGKNGVPSGTSIRCYSFVTKNRSTLGISAPADGLPPSSSAGQPVATLHSSEADPSSRGN